MENKTSSSLSDPRLLGHHRPSRALYLVVPRHDLGVARRARLARAALPRVAAVLRRRAVRGVGLLGPALGRGRGARAVAYDDVGYAAGLFLVEGLVVLGVGEFRDDVPGVEEAGDLGGWLVWGAKWERRGLGLGIEIARGTYVAEDEEEDVEEGVDGADAALYPDCRDVSIRATRLASGKSRYLAGAGRGWRGRRGRCPGCTSRVSCVRGSYDSVMRCCFLCTVGCRAILGEGGER